MMRGRGRPVEKRLKEEKCFWSQLRPRRLESREKQQRVSGQGKGQRRESGHRAVNQVRGKAQMKF